MTRCIGFTGSRTPPSEHQLDALSDLLAAKRGINSTFAQGDCIGGDEAAHFIAMELGYVVHVFPPIINMHRAFTTGHFVYPEKPYAIRNALIVMMADELIAVPNRPEEDAPRSGTWQTVRKARAKGIQVTIVWPDGTVEVEPARDEAVQSS